MKGQGRPQNRNPQDRTHASPDKKQTDLQDEASGSVSNSHGQHTAQKGKGQQVVDPDEIEMDMNDDEDGSVYDNEEGSESEDDDDEINDAGQV